MQSNSLVFLVLTWLALTASQEQPINQIHLEPKSPNVTSHQFGNESFIEWENGKYYSNNYFRPDGDLFNIWQVANNCSNDTFIYEEMNGEVMVVTDSLYMIYTQMSFESDKSSQVVKISDEGNTNGHDFIICTEASTTPGNAGSCYTSGVTPLLAGQRVWIELGRPSRGVNLSSDVTFWGILKLGPI